MASVSRILPFFAGKLIMARHADKSVNLQRAISVAKMKRMKKLEPDTADAEISLVDGSVRFRNVKAKLQNKPESQDTRTGHLESTERKGEGLNLKSLRDRNKRESNKNEEETKSNVKRVRGKIRAVVDLEMMKEELKQLEDPPLSPLARELTEGRLGLSFFDAPCEDLAKNLLGKILVRRLDNGAVMKGKIVETEGYLGAIDKASHSYQSKVTPRNMPMFMPPGTIYVYMTYGMYHCFNLSSQGEGCAVLIRALEPLEGMENMLAERNSKTKSKKDPKIHELCNGPSKLCMTFRLDKTHSKYSICTWKGLWIEGNDQEEEIKIVKCSRIGIDSCGPEWANKPLRYYIYGNKFVSKRDKKAEASLETD